MSEPLTPSELAQRRATLTRDYLLGACYVESCDQPAVEKLRLHRGQKPVPDADAVEVCACLDHAAFIRMLAK